MFVVTVEFTVDPAQWDAFLPLMLENAERSREEEPGCRQFDVCMNSEARPGTVYLYELYDDRKAFDAHLASSHFLQFAAATQEMIRERVIGTWNRVSESICA